MSPAVSNFASSFLMASLFSAENLRSLCFFGVVVGLTFRECLINSFWDTGHISWFPCKYVAVGPKEVDERVFLFVSKSCPDQGCLDLNFFFQGHLMVPRIAVEGG